MKLYDYYRSTASYRVRIALQYKQLSYQCLPVHLTLDGGEQHQSAYLDLNPQGLVPCLDDNGQLLSQSLAIIEYLEEKYPSPALLPNSPWDRAQVRSLSLLIACDLHPLNNLRVLEQLKEQFQATDIQVEAWYHHWLKLGFDAFEQRLYGIPRTKPLCLGDEISVADVCLIPQVYNAKRFNFSMQKYPLIEEINAYCLSLESFAKAAP